MKTDHRHDARCPTRRYSGRTPRSLRSLVRPPLNVRVVSPIPADQPSQATVRDGLLGPPDAEPGTPTAITR
jgi:hypothetical protein